MKALISFILLVLIGKCSNSDREEYQEYLRKLIATYDWYYNEENNKWERFMFDCECVGINSGSYGCAFWQRIYLYYVPEFNQFSSYVQQIHGKDYSFSCYYNEDNNKWEPKLVRFKWRSILISKKQHQATDETEDEIKPKHSGVRYNDEQVKNMLQMMPLEVVELYIKEYEEEYKRLIKDLTELDEKINEERNQNMKKYEEEMKKIYGEHDWSLMIGGKLTEHDERSSFRGELLGRINNAEKQPENFKAYDNKLYLDYINKIDRTKLAKVKYLEMNLFTKEIMGNLLDKRNARGMILGKGFDEHLLNAINSSATLPCPKCQQWCTNKMANYYDCTRYCKNTTCCPVKYECDSNCNKPIIPM
uniref:Uncharacterized protein n=1 Tax=Meloidogyne hapla TaxID=6305 RepID=A0A1I8BYT3_MELHA